jgi:cobalt/nickel transport system permease protein
VSAVLVRFAPPPWTDSPLARLDPRWRLAGLLAVVVATSALVSLTAALAALFGAVLLAALARMSWRWYLERLAVLAVLLALFVLPVALLARIDLAEGLRLAGRDLAKGLALFSLVCVLLVSAPLETTLRAAQALLVPGLLTQLALLCYRYLFLFGNELDRLRVALRVRGFRNRADRHSYRTVSAATGTLLVRGHDRAERVGHAMRCRGFDGRFRSLAEFATRRRDVLACLLLVLAACAAVWLDRAWMGR